MAQRLRLSLNAWRRVSANIDGERGSPGLWTRSAYLLSSAVNTILFRLQTASLAEALKSVHPQPPIFVLGFWRSGTTLLHELLCCDPRYGFPSTYACMNPSHFALTERFSASVTSQKATSRPMDNMQYTWASPQEDEFALLALGAPSPYEALLIPSLMQNPTGLVDWRKENDLERQHWIDAFQSFLQLLTLQQQKTMIFKSPPHGFKLSMLLSLFPQAKYIVIERNPYEVFASNLKLWRTLLGLYALEPWSDADIELFVLKSYRIHEELIEEGICSHQEAFIARVRYEDVVDNPIAQIERLYDHLELGNFDEIRDRVSRYSEKVAGHARNHFAISSEQKRNVEREWGGLIEKKDYLWPGKYLSVQPESERALQPNVIH
jgi:hypothetical protein